MFFVIFRWSLGKLKYAGILATKLFYRVAQLNYIRVRKTLMKTKDGLKVKYIFEHAGYVQFDRVLIFFWSDEGNYVCRTFFVIIPALVLYVAVFYKPLTLSCCSV